MDSRTPLSPYQTQAAAERLIFAGLPFDQVSVADAVARMAARPADAPFGYFSTPNAEYVFWGRRTPPFRQVLADAWLCTCDSRILRRIAAWRGVTLVLTPGSYVVPPLFAEAIRPDDPLALIGGTAEIAKLLRGRFALTRLAQHIPPMGFIRDPAAVAAAVAFAAAHPARFTFIAMGPPHSDMLAARIAAAGEARGLGLCVGSSLTTLLGLTPAAPDWMERNGLVWLFRLWREPRRLWRRYLGRSLLGCLIALTEGLAARGR